VLLLDTIVLAALVLFAGIFAATETAYTGLSFHQLRRTQKLHPGALSLWEKEPHRVLATLLLSNNAVNAGAGVLAAAAASVIAHRHGWRTSFLSILFGFLVSCLILIFGEILPKLLAQRFTVPWALLITPLMRRWTAVVSPFAGGAAEIANRLLLGLTRRAPPMPFLNESALRRILMHAQIPPTSHRLINNVIEFGQLTVKDVARDRSEIVAVPITSSLERVVQNVVQSGYSRLPVTLSGLDDVVGLLMAKDLLVAWRSGTLVVFQDLVRPLPIVTPEMPLPDLLRLFRSRRQHLAVVKNRNSGRVVGLVTLQNALAALVGQIKEEN